MGEAASTNFATSYEMQILRLHDVKATIAPGMVEITKTISETGIDPENILTDIIKIARVLDITAPAPHRSSNSLGDPRYNLLDYIKKNAGSMAVRMIDGDNTLFADNIRYTCVSQIQELYEDLAAKINRHYIEVQ